MGKAAEDGGGAPRGPDSEPGLWHSMNGGREAHKSGERGGSEGHLTGPERERVCVRLERGRRRRPRGRVSMDAACLGQSLITAGSFEGQMAALAIHLSCPHNPVRQASLDQSGGLARSSPPSPSSLPRVDRLNEAWVVCCSHADSVSKTCEDSKVQGLEVDDDDGEELVEDHNTDLTTEELQDLQKEQQQTAAEELSSEEERREDFPTSLIKEMLGKWGEMQSFVEKDHPNKEVANCAINLFNDNAVFHFRPSVKTEAKTIITG